MEEPNKVNNLSRSSRIPEGVSNYKPLPKELTLNGLRYTLIKRSDEVYLYALATLGKDKPHSVEVGIINVLKPDKFSDKWRERPMSNSQFGTRYGQAYAWRNKDKAEIWFQKYNEQLRNKQSKGK